MKEAVFSCFLIPEMSELLDLWKKRVIFAHTAVIIEADRNAKSFLKEICI